MRPIRVLNVHFMTGDPKGELRGQGTALPRRVVLSARTRTVQAEALRDLVLQRPMPTVVTGDFNSPPTSQAYAILSTVLDDVFGRSGLGVGFTYSTVWPLWRIDCVWCRGLQPLSARVVNAAVSDHRAVICEVRLGVPGR